MKKNLSIKNDTCWMCVCVCDLYFVCATISATWFIHFKGIHCNVHSFQQNTTRRIHIKKTITHLQQHT